jgi:hypothetical protein
MWEERFCVSQWVLSMDWSLTSRGGKNLVFDLASRAHPAFCTIGTAGLLSWRYSVRVVELVLHFSADIKA